MINDVAAIVLAGGDSKRMGTDKNLIKLNNRKMIEVVIDNLSSTFTNIIVVTNSPEKLIIENRANSVIHVLEDRFRSEEKNSLRGIFTGLDEISQQYGFVFAGDMPFINIFLVNAMAGIVENEKWDVVIPKLEGYYEPLFAIYHQNCLPYMKKQLDKGNYKIINFFAEVNVQELSMNFCKKYDQELKSFFNVNTPEQLEMAKKYFESDKNGLLD